jgi:hypothetical protein
LCEHFTFPQLGHRNLVSAFDSLPGKHYHADAFEIGYGDYHIIPTIINQILDLSWLLLLESSLSISTKISSLIFHAAGEEVQHARSIPSAGASIEKNGKCLLWHPDDINIWYSS